MQKKFRNSAAGVVFCRFLQNNLRRMRVWFFPRYHERFAGCGDVVFCHLPEVFRFPFPLREMLRSVVLCNDDIFSRLQNGNFVLQSKKF